MINEKIREVMKSIESEIQEIGSRFMYERSTEEKKKELESCLNNMLKKYIIENRIENGITVKVFCEGSNVLYNFYYNDRKLYLRSMEDLVNFNPNDYYYIINDQVYRHCPGNIKLTLSLEPERTVKMIQINECRKCPYMQLRSKRRNLGVCDNLDLDLLHDEENFELKDNYIPDWCPLENYKKVDEVNSDEK